MTLNEIANRGPQPFSIIAREEFGRLPRALTKEVWDSIQEKDKKKAKEIEAYKTMALWEYDQGSPLKFGVALHKMIDRVLNFMTYWDERERIEAGVVIES